MFDILHEQINNFISFGEIEFDENHIQFTANPSSTVDLFQLLPFSSQLPLPSISVDQLLYTFATSELTVSTRGYGSQTIIPEVLDL